MVIGVATCLFGADSKPPVQLTHTQAVSDTRTFIRFLEATHPDPYTNLGGKIAFKWKAKQLVAALPSDGLTVPELADRLAVFVAPLKDGHTRIRGSREKWQDSSPKLPVRFLILSDGLVLAASDLPGLKGTRGYRLRAVNGHSVAELLERMSSEVATENAYGAYTGLTVALRSRKFLTNLIPDLQPSTAVVFNLEALNGKPVNREIVWEGTHSDDPEKWLDKPLRWSGFDRSDEMFYYRFLSDGRTAYFRVGTMMGREGYEVAQRYNVANLRELLEAYYKSHGQPMPSDVETAMRGLPSVFEQGTQLLEEMKRRNTPNLIIDVRGNGGGSTPTIYPFFYQMFGDAYFGRDSLAEFVTVKSQLYLEKYHSSSEQERKKNADFEVGEYDFSHPESLPAAAKRKAKFDEWREKGFSWMKSLDSLNERPLYTPKRIVVLCDPGTFSAAFQMTFYLHEMGAKLVGVPPAQSPNAFMEGTEFVLPESGIPGYISNGLQMFMPQDPKANILHPDFEVTYAVYKKFGFDEDTALRYTLDLMVDGKI
jgi:hypothetical protein